MCKIDINAFKCPVCKSNHFARMIPRRIGGTVAECAGCYHLTLWPQPGEHEISSWYKESALDKLKDHGSALLDNPALRLLEKCDSRKELKVLDIGCGSGIFLRNCAKKNHKVSGIDVSRNLIDHLASEGFEVFHKSLEELRNTEQQYDWVICLDVIEHIKDPMTAIDTLAGLIKPKGKLAIQTPNGDAIALYRENAYGLTVDKEHLNYFRPGQLKRLFESKGFDLVCKKYLPRSEGRGRASASKKNKCTPNSSSSRTGSIQPYATKAKPSGIRKITGELPPGIRGSLRSIAQIARHVFSIDEIIMGRAHEFIIIMSRR